MLRDLGSLLLNLNPLLIFLLLALGWSHAVLCLSASNFSRVEILVRRTLVPKDLRLAKLICLIQIFDSVIEVVICFELLFLDISRLLLLGTIFLTTLTRLLHLGKLSELSIADSTISIVVTSTKDGLDIFSAREECVLLKVCNEVWHSDRVIPLGDAVKDADLDEICACLQLSLSFSTGTLQSHLLVEEASKE